MTNEWVRKGFQGALASATLAINERSAELIHDGRQVFRLGLGQSPFPVPEEVVQSLREHATEKDYLPVQGLARLRQAVADHHAREDGWQGGAHQVVVGPGSKELLFLLQLVLDANLLVPTPCWVTYPPQSRMVGHQPELVRTSFDEAWRLDPEELAVRARVSKERLLLVLNYPNNPTGQTYQEQELQAIAEVAREHGLLVFSDEIYGRLHYRGAHCSISRFYPEGTIVGSGLSKWCGAGGWRLGTFLFPRQLDAVCQAVIAAASETFTSVSAPVQYAAVDAFVGSPAIDDYLKHSRRVLASLAELVVDELTSADLTLRPPEGAFYAFVGFEKYSERLARRGIKTSARLTEKILEETGVALLPGAPFGRVDADLWVRLAFVDFDGATALTASREIGLDQTLSVGLIERICGPTVEALKRLGAWAKAMS